MRRNNPRFGEALVRVRSSLHLSQEDLGKRVGVTRRTLTRWEGGEMPPVGQQKHLVTVLADAPTELYGALLDASEVDAAFKDLVGRRGPGDPAPGAADGALLEMAEALDISPLRLRSALLAFLFRAHEAGLTLDTARALLAKKTLNPKAASASSRAKRPD